RALPDRSWQFSSSLSRGAPRRALTWHVGSRIKRIQSISGNFCADASSDMNPGASEWFRGSGCEANERGFFRLFENAKARKSENAKFLRERTTKTRRAQRSTKITKDGTEGRAQAAPYGCVGSRRPDLSGLPGAPEAERVAQAGMDRGARL